MSSTATTDSSHDESSDQEKAIVAKKALLNKDQEATPEQEQQGVIIPEPQKPIPHDLASQESSNGRDADDQVPSTPQTNGHHAESEQPQAETGLTADHEEARQQPEDTLEQSQQKKASFSPAKESMFATFQQHFATQLERHALKTDQKKKNFDSQ